jgi:hypothetical protein
LKKLRGCEESSMWHWGAQKYTGILWRHLKEEHLEELCVDGRILLKPFLKKDDGRVWTGLTWLRIGVIGGLL